MIFCLSFSFALMACEDESTNPNGGIDISGVTFVDATFEYDGEEHSISVKNLPSGVTVTYSGNDQTEPGTYYVTAKLVDSDGNELGVLSARLIITEVSGNLPTDDPTNTPTEEPTDDPTNGNDNTVLPTTGYAVKVGDTVYPLSENTAATLLTGQLAEYMALGLNVTAGEKFAVYKDGVEITTGIGPDAGDNNATGTNGAFTVVKSAEDVAVYFKVWQDGHSFWLEGNTGNVGGGDNLPTGNPASTLYLKPNSNWIKDGARFAAYFFGNGETWVSMTDEDGDGIYECEVPAGYAQVIFCRMNSNASQNNWNNRWNQTADLTIPSDGTNLYTVKDGTWDNGGGSWSTK